MTESLDKIFFDHKNNILYHNMNSDVIDVNIFIQFI
jgi:hypothetical protein